MQQDTLPNSAEVFIGLFDTDLNEHAFLLQKKSQQEVWKSNLLMQILQTRNLLLNKTFGQKTCGGVNAVVFSCFYTDMIKMSNEIRKIPIITRS